MLLPFGSSARGLFSFPDFFRLPFPTAPAAPVQLSATAKKPSCYSDPAFPPVAGIISRLEKEQHRVFSGQSAT